MNEAITKKDLKDALEMLSKTALKEAFQEFGKQLEKRFVSIDQRFDAVDQRFDAVDKRFDSVDRKFELMDKRFDRVEVRLDGIDMRIDNVECQIEDLALMTKVQFDDLDRKVSVLSLRTGGYR